MLKAIFYARFHPERGPSIIHQYPAGSVLRSHDKPLTNWSDISSYIIPPYDLCNKSLSICTDGHRVLAYPVSLEDSKYDRNRFTFNICFVLAEDEDAQPWEQVVRKTARFLVALEEEDGLLQQEERLAGLKWAGEEDYPAQDVGVIYKLLSGVFDDMNEYGETCVKVDKVHVLNLRLEFEQPMPFKVRAWDVPLLIRSLPLSAELTWDLTLQRIYSHIDGIRHVQRIAEVADAEVKLVKQAIYELVYHDHAMILDIFHFQAIYTCTDNVAALIEDEDVQDECRRYVAIQTPNIDANKRSSNVSEDKEHPQDSPTRHEILHLFSLLGPGVQLSDFCLTHKALLANIDIRRFITFGVIKGLLRRIHKYVLALDPQMASPELRTKQKSGTPSSKPRSNEDIVREFDRAWRKAALSSGWATPPTGPPPASFGKSNRSAEHVRAEENEKLRQYLDGNHCMDQICVEMHMSEKKVLEILRSGRLGDFVLFNK